MSEFSDEERVGLAMREMLAVDPGTEAFADPGEIRKHGGWRWRHRIDLKVVVAAAAVVILVATLVLAGPLRPGPHKQRVTDTNPTVTSTTSRPSTSLPCRDHSAHDNGADRHSDWRLRGLHKSQCRTCGDRPDLR